MSWKDKGYTQIPNIVLNNPAVPRCVRGTYEAISARAFGKKPSVNVSEETLANDVGVSRSTILRHLKVLEALFLIRRIRIGRGLSNAIILTLKVSNPNLIESISQGTKGLSQHILNREKLTMKEALVLSGEHRRKQKQLTGILAQAQAIVRAKNKEYREV